MVVPHRVAVVVTNDFDLLELGNLSTIFTMANEVLSQTAYRVTVLSDVSPIASHNGVSLNVMPLASQPPEEVDTLLVCGAGGGAMFAFLESEATKSWLHTAARLAQRCGCVGTGFQSLVHTNLLQQRRATVHWEHKAEMRRRYPELDMDDSVLFSRAGKVWSCAGYTAALDLALDMVEADYGALVANLLAKRLLIHSRRAGHQQQISPLLLAQTHAQHDVAFVRLTEWICSNIALPIDVATLASQAGMSPRNFHRRFTASMGLTPANFVEIIRVTYAQELLNARVPPKVVAARSGFSSPSKMSKAIARQSTLRLVSSAPCNRSIQVARARIAA